jgi:hypothetical protein
MCDKCTELDKKIAHYRKLAAAVLDRRVLDGIHALIVKYEADKRAAHPDAPEVY